MGEAFSKSTGPTCDDTTTCEHGHPQTPSESTSSLAASPVKTLATVGTELELGGRSGLWKEFARIVRCLRPRYVVVENVAALAVRGLDVVLRDLAILGFDAEWGLLPACAMGAPHTRERLFIVANSKGCRRFSPPHPVGRGRETDDGSDWPVSPQQARRCLGDGRGEWWAREPGMARVVDGVPAEVDAPNRAIGNSISPIVAEWLGLGVFDAASAIH